MLAFAERELADAAGREASRAHVAALLRDHHLALPDAQTTHLRMDLGVFRIRWELHTEFVSWTFMVPTPVEAFGERDPTSAIDVVPREWLAALPGQCLCSLNLWVLRGAVGWWHAVLGAPLCTGRCTVLPNHLAKKQRHPRVPLCLQPGPALRDRGIGSVFDEGLFALVLHGRQQHDDEQQHSHSQQTRRQRTGHKHTPFATR